MMGKSAEALYSAPELEIHEVATEAGFAQSSAPASTPPDFAWDDLLS